MSSFYGGRPGNPFSIVATFSSVNVMVTQFKKGPNYTAVHYDEHVSISSNDSDNGNVYRRGYNYTNSMGGAELVGNLLKGTSGGASVELVDIRTGYDGTIYESAGDAVRSQSMKIDTTLTTVGTELRDIRVGTDGITYASAGDAVRNIGEKAAYIFEKAGYAKLVGGSGEAWSVREFTAKAGRKYTLTIPSFTPRSTLTVDYAAYDVYKDNTSTTANRLAASSIGIYNNNNHPVVTVNIDNSNEQADKIIIVRLRPETNAKVYVTFEDTTDTKRIGALETTVSSLAPVVTANQTALQTIKAYFDRQTGTADFSTTAIGATYQGKPVNISIPSGATVKIDIASSAGTNDQNQLYMNMDAPTGTPRLFQAVGSGKGTRTITWTNTSETDVGIIRVVLVEVLEQNTYTITVTKSDFLSDTVTGLVEDVDALSDRVDEDITYVFEKSGYADIVGSTGESYNVHEFTIESGKKYTLTIPSFTPRSTLSDDYTAYDVYKNDTSTLGNRMTASGIGPYNSAGRPVVTFDINNTAGSIQKIIVRLRLNPSDKIRIILEDVTDTKRIGALETTVSSLAPVVTANQTALQTIKAYFDRQTGTADFSTTAIGATYQGKPVNISIPSGATVKIDIASSAGTNDQNQLYMNMDAPTGTPRLFSGIGPGKGTRTITWTNTSETDVGIIKVVLVEVLEQNTYTITVTKSDFLPDTVTGLVEDVGALSDRVDEMSDPTYVVPTYFETQLSSAISSAKTNMLDIARNGETFIFISDLHWSGNAKHSPALVRAVTQALPIDKLIFGGDAFNGGTRDESVALMDDIRQKFSGAAKHFVSCFGNHDTNALDGGTEFQKNEFYTMLQKQSDDFVTYGDYYYFYFDNPTTATRFICLDTRTGTPPYAIYQAEIAWLQDVINTAPSGYHFLIFAHVVYYRPADISYNDPLYTDPSAWISSTFMQDVFTVLDTAKSNGKSIEAFFAGHCHMDYHSATSGGIPVVLIDCDGRQTLSGNSQALGTVNEQAFDIVSVDYAAKTVKCVRIGRGSNRTISYGNE